MKTLSCGQVPTPLKKSLLSPLLFLPFNEETCSSDKRGHYHVMYHRMGSGVPSGWVGHHAWSIDGFTWSDTQPCYDNTFSIEGGTTVVGVANGGAQRPKLLVQNGTATHLYVAGPMSGCPKCKGDYTLVSPLNV